MAMSWDALGVGMGFPLFWSICISGVIIVLYTFLGGLKATLVCDFIQFFVILAVVFALPPLCLGRIAALDGGSGLVHGFRQFLARVPDGFFSFTSGKYTWTYTVAPK
jgi:Na+/proline symporter